MWLCRLGRQKKKKKKKKAVLKQKDMAVEGAIRTEHEEQNDTFIHNNVLMNNLLVSEWARVSVA